MITRLFISLYVVINVVIISVIQIISLPIELLLLTLFPIIKWVYWIVTNKSITMAQYDDKIASFPYNFLEKKINNKIK